MTLSDLDVGDYTIFVWTILQIVLTALYGSRSKWWASTPGQILFTSFCCTSIALTQVSITLLTDSGYVGRDIVRPIAYTLGTIGALVMIRLVLQMQGKDRRR